MANRPKTPPPRYASPPGRTPGDSEVPAGEPPGTGSGAARQGRAPAVTDRITVSLVPKAFADLQRTQDRTHMSKTDIINRAISVYEFIEAELGEGAEIIVHRDGRDHYVKLL
jgi:hypothetical protein